MTEQINGAVVSVPLTSGVPANVTTLTPAAWRGIVAAAEKRHPRPNPDDYSNPILNALPGTDAKTIGKDDPEYLAADAAAIQAQSDFIIDALLQVAVGADNEADIVASYAPKVDKLRAIGALVEHEGDSPFIVVLRNFLAVGEQDINMLVLAAQMRLPVTPVEVASSRAYFRVDMQRKADRPISLRRETPRTERGKVGKTESPMAGD